MSTDALADFDRDDAEPRSSMIADALPQEASREARDALQSAVRTIALAEPHLKLTVWKNQAAELAKLVGQGLVEPAGYADFFRELAANHGIYSNDVETEIGSLLTVSREQARAPVAIEVSAKRNVSQLRFELRSFADIKVDSSRRGYLVKNLLPSSGLTVIWGPPKCGKSFWAVDLGLHIALGWEYRGRRVQQAAVVYVALEGQHGLPARIEAFRRHHNVGDAPFFLVTSRLNLIADATKLVADIRSQLPAAVTPGVVFIDTLNRSLVGSESKDEDMAKYLAAAEMVASELKCAVAIVHHCGIDASRPRGHTSLTGSVESQLAVRRGGTGEVVVSVEYAKDMPEGDEIVSRLEQVIVGKDPDGDDITTLVVLPSDTAFHAAPAALKREAKSKRTFRNAFTEALDAHGEDIRVLQDGPIVRAVEVSHVRSEFYRRHVTGEAEAGKATEARQKAFKRALNDLPHGITSATQNGSEWLWLA